MIAGLAASLPPTLYRGLISHGVPSAVATQVSHLPPVSSLFGALLGYNPMAALLPHSVLAGLPPGQAAILTGKAFFPQLISGPFQQGLTIVFVVATVLTLGAAAASWLRGGRYVHVESETEHAAGLPLKTATMADPPLSRFAPEERPERRK